MAGYDPKISHIHESTIQAKQRLFEEELIEAASRTAFGYQQQATRVRDVPTLRITIANDKNYLPSTQLVQHVREWSAVVEKSRRGKETTEESAYVVQTIAEYPRVFQDMAERSANPESDLVYSREALGAWCSAGGVQSAYCFTSDTPKAIDWEKWRTMPRIVLWEAAALSCGQPPEAAKKHLNLNEIDGEIANPLRVTWASLFNDRIEMLRRNTSKGNALYILGAHCYPNSNHLEIDTVQFATFARNHAWEVPAELLALASAPTIAARATTSGQWPWGTHNTRLLTVLQQAAEKWWVNYDPTDPTSAPTNEVVVTWIVTKNLASENLAKAMATILRADGLQTGPRK